MSGSGDVQPFTDYNWVPQPAIWGTVDSGNNLTMYTQPDYTIMRIDYASLTLRYQYTDQMAQAELQYGNVDTGDRGAILAVGAFSDPSYSEFIYQQRYWVATECPIYISKGAFLQSIVLDSSTVGGGGGASRINAFVGFSLAYGAPGVF